MRPLTMRLPHAPLGPEAQPVLPVHPCCDDAMLLDLRMPCCRTLEGRARGQLAGRNMLAAPTRGLLSATFLCKCAGAGVFSVFGSCSGLAAGRCAGTAECVTSLADQPRSDTCQGRHPVIASGGSGHERN